jgi:CRP-like cAMP-binding protein
MAALPLADQRRLQRCGEQVLLQHGTVLCEPGATISHVYFPLDCIITLLAGVAGKVELEAGLVGDEGAVGLTLLLGVKVAPLRWFVEKSGQAWRIDAASFLGELARSPSLRRHLDRYLYVTLVQLTQSATCMRFHVVEARLARWLLMTRDRAHADDFRITHESLAHFMGVRRAGITRAASSLQRRKLIHYNRGDLHILEAVGLEKASCFCYGADNAVYAQIMGQDRRPGPVAAQAP